MSNATMPPQSTSAGSSLQKNLIFSEYVNGDLSLHDASLRAEQVKPKEENVTALAKFALGLAVVILALLFPSWARRND